MYTLIGSAKLNGIDPEAWEPVYHSPAQIQEFSAISHTYWHALPATPSAESTNSCPGTSVFRLAIRRTKLIESVRNFSLRTPAPDYNFAVVWVKTVSTRRLRFTN